MLNKPMWTHWSLYLSPFLLSLVPSFFFFPFFLALSLFMRKSLLALCLKQSAKIRYSIGVNESSSGESVSPAFTQAPWIHLSILWQQSKQGSSNSVQKVTCCTNYAKAASNKWCMVFLCILSGLKWQEDLFLILQLSEFLSLRLCSHSSMKRM